MKSYELLDSGDGTKWEQFGPYILQRPSPQAVWRPTKKIKADASFTREAKWTFARPLPKEWHVEIEGITLSIKPTDFGHVGLFPEHQLLWRAIQKRVGRGDHFLNVFAYSGGATLIAAKMGAEVCHVDASKGMVAWARENSHLSRLDKAPIRWIVDDAVKFLRREVKRGVQYDHILLDPPSFGRGSQGEVFKIEDEIHPLLEAAIALKPRSLFLSCHTPGWTGTVLEQLVKQLFPATFTSGDLALEGEFTIPSGSFTMGFR